MTDYWPQVEARVSRAPRRALAVRPGASARWPFLTKNQQPTTNNSSVTCRPGVTLLELLIVMTIILMVTAAAIPLVMPAMQNRQMREAARLISSFYAGARSRAVETGRPVGVMIERENGQPYATRLSYVDVPPPYAGDVAYATCDVEYHTMAHGPYTDPHLEIEVKFGAFNPNQVRIGDQIQFNFQGPTYPIIGPDLLPAGMPDGVLDPGNGTIVEILAAVDLTAPHDRWKGSNASMDNVQYQIIRQPIRSSSAPLQLPEGIVIDLLGCGYAWGGYFPTVANIGGVPQLTFLPTWIADGGPMANYRLAANFNPIVTFSPSGAIDRVWLPKGPPDPNTGLSTVVPVRFTESIYVLTGRRELMPDVSKSGHDENLYDPTTPAKNLYLQNFWIAIGSQTGLITIAEMNAHSDWADVVTARAFAASSQGVGGQ